MPPGLCTLRLLSFSVSPPTGEGTVMSSFVKSAGGVALSEEDDGYDGD